MWCVLSIQIPEFSPFRKYAGQVAFKVRRACRTLDYFRLLTFLKLNRCFFSTDQRRSCEGWESVRREVSWLPGCPGRSKIDALNGSMDSNWNMTWLLLPTRRFITLFLFTCFDPLLTLQRFTHELSNIWILRYTRFYGALVMGSLVVYNCRILRWPRQRQDLLLVSK